ncbi:hypothetical protein Sa4125_32070 [Aureimonas sp. SA4125]|nr:hypothetical protein Sa4125_32070 [Aureimonas sp. SA4125]
MYMSFLALSQPIHSHGASPRRHRVSVFHGDFPDVVAFEIPIAGKTNLNQAVEVLGTGESIGAK